MREAVGEVLDRFMRYVQDEEYKGDPVLSLYVVVDPGDQANQAATPAWQVWLKNALTQIEQGLAAEGLPRWQGVRARVEQYLTDYRPTGRTLVLFVAPDAELAYDVPVRLANQAFYGIAHLAEFLWAVDEFEEHLVVLFGQDQARATTLLLGRAADDITVRADQTWHRKLRKSAHQANIAQRQDELDRRFMREVAEEIDRHFLYHTDIERIVFGGDQRMAHAVRKLLHPKVADQVIGIVRLPFETPDHEIVTATQDLALQYEREHDLAVVNDVINRAKSGGRGALGIEAVAEALAMQAVSLLVLPYPINPVFDDKLLVKAVKSSSQFEFVFGEAADRLNAEGGIGALLYYTVSTTTG